MPVIASACGFTNNSDHCVMETECVYSGLVYMFIADFGEINWVFLSSAPYRQTDNFYKNNFLSSGYSKTDINSKPSKYVSSIIYYTLYNSQESKTAV